jgi:hypothetical protein
MDSGICQTSTASPAQPGGLPFVLARLAALTWRVGRSATLQYYTYLEFIPQRERMPRGWVSNPE